MFNKKVLLLCFLGTGLVPNTSLAMDSYPLSGPFKRLAAAMQPFLNAQAYVPEAADNLTLAVTLVDSIVGIVGEDADMCQSVDSLYNIRLGIANSNYRQIIASYRLILQWQILPNFGLLMPADAECARAELQKADTEIQQWIDHDYPQAPNFSPWRVVSALGAVSGLGLLTYVLVHALLHKKS